MYEDKTPEAIKAEILAAIRQSQGLSAMAGGFADGVAGPVAEQLSEAYRALEGVTSMLFVDESSGGYIDLVGGQYYSITRREGTRAYCDMTFNGAPGLEPSRTPSGRHWRAICTPSLRASTARCTTSPPTTSPTRCSITGCWPCCSMWRGWRTSPPSPSTAAPPT